MSDSTPATVARPAVRLICVGCATGAAGADALGGAGAGANGQVTQQPFVGRTPANASTAERQALQARNNAQQFFPNPKVFGVGGA